VITIGDGFPAAVASAPNGHFVVVAVGDNAAALIATPPMPVGDVYTLGGDTIDWRAGDTSSESPRTWTLSATSSPDPADRRYAVITATARLNSGVAAYRVNADLTASSADVLNGSWPIYFGAVLPGVPVTRTVRVPIWKSSAGERREYAMTLRRFGAPTMRFGETTIAAKPVTITRQMPADGTVLNIEFHVTLTDEVVGEDVNGEDPPDYITHTQSLTRTGTITIVSCDKLRRRATEIRYTPSLDTIASVQMTNIEDLDVPDATETDTVILGQVWTATCADGVQIAV
jgi:hypothetical protein